MYVFCLCRIDLLRDVLNQLLMSSKIGFQSPLLRWMVELCTYARIHIARMADVVEDLNITYEVSLILL